MGNLHVRSSYHGNKDENGCATDFYWQMLSAKPGQLLHDCSFEKWKRHHRKLCGFLDKTDFSTVREGQKRCGILVKPDTTDGRYFGVSMKSKLEIVIIEKFAWWVGSVRVPHVHVPDTEDYMWFRHARRDRSRKDCSVIAYKDGLAVVQINCNRHYSIGRFYLLDLLHKTCIGHFLITYRNKRWYECYISPSKRKILLRPDHVTRVVVLPDNYVIHNLTLFMGEREAPSVDTIPPALRTHVLTFNRKLGDDYIILGIDQDIEIRKLSDWSIVRRVPDLELITSIQQICSSPQGDFIAIRCVHPINNRSGFSSNLVAVLNYPKLDILMKFDVCGCFRPHPVMDVINFQVFPRFSPSEACVAVMRNCSDKQKVFVYKLPPILTSLQQLCRRAILQLVPLKDTEKLPLPNKLLDFLQFQEKSLCSAY